MKVNIEGNVPKTVQKIIFTLDDQTKKSTYFSVDGTGTCIPSTRVPQGKYLDNINVFAGTCPKGESCADPAFVKYDGKPRLVTISDKAQQVNLVQFS